MWSLLTAMAVTMLLGGCAVTVPPEHWAKSGATQEAFLKDYTTCRNEALADRFGFSKGDPLLTCMETRGYKRELQRRVVCTRGTGEKRLHQQCAYCAHDEPHDCGGKSGLQSGSR